MNQNTATTTRIDRGYAEARKMAVRRAAYLWDLAQTNATMRERCLRFGINPDLPLGPQVSSQP